MGDRRPALISAGLAALLLAAGWVWRPPAVGLCTSILVASSNEKFGTLQTLASQYSSRHPGSKGCIPVRVEKVASGDAEQRLLAGWSGASRPDVWSPAATTWVVLLRQQLAPDQALLPDHYTSIAQSPLVIGMPLDMANALGWPASQPNWRELLHLSQDPSGWGRYGHPEWGQFSLGQTDPRISTSGLHALIASYYAATGKSADLVASDITGKQSTAFVKAEETSVAHYSDTAENFLLNLKAADDANNALGYISAVTLEEQELWQYNRGQIGERAAVTPPRVKLAAIYPKDGTLVADHPYVVLKGISPAKSRLADGFLAWLQLTAQQQAFANAGFRNFQNVQSNIGGGILAAEPNLVLRSPAPEIIALIQQSWQQVRKRGRVLIVVDGTTPSVRGKVAKAIGQLAADDEVGVWVAGPDEKTQPFKEIRAVALAGVDPSQLEAMVTQIPPEQGSPPLLAAIESGYKYMKANSDPSRINAVLVIAGGKNDDSRGPDLVTLLGEVRSDPKGNVTRVFAVSTSKDDDETMRRIAQSSGGVAFTALDPDAVAHALKLLVAYF